LDKVNSVLVKFSKDERPEVAETCQLALARLDWLEKKKSSNDQSDKLSKNPYYSVDPAPPDVNKNIEYLKNKLIDESESMFERYRAMFQLRNDGSDAAILALCEGKIPTNLNW
jgi:deoxyhypusine monooxygenase